MAITKLMKENALFLNKLIELRNIKNKTNSKKDKKNYDNYFHIVLDRFSYMVSTHTNRYKKYANYQDLYQEGLMGLFLALDKYDPKRSKNFFKLASWYIGTRIKRSAHKHDVIRLSDKESKGDNHLNRVENIPVIIDEEKNAHECLESFCINSNVKFAIAQLPELERKIVNMYFGIDKTTNNTIAKISCRIKMPRVKVEELLSSACKKLCEDLKDLTP